MRRLRWLALAVGLALAALVPVLGSRAWISAAEPPQNQVPPRDFLLEEPFRNDGTYPPNGAASSRSIGSIGYADALTYTLSLPTVQRVAPPYTDDFSNSSSGWSTLETAISARSYVDGEYRIFLKQANAIATSGRGLQATNFRAEVDVRAASTITGSYGLDFGYGPDGYYFYEVTPFFGGQYALFRKDNATGYFVIVLNWTPSPQIRTDNAVNRLRVDRQGTTITLYINGQQVDHVVDSTLGRGIAGLAAHSYAPNFDVRFDNYLLDASVMAP